MFVIKVQLLPKSTHFVTTYIVVATLALGSQPRQRELQGCGPKGSPGVKPRGRPGIKAKALQECGPRGSPGVKARRSPIVTSHTPESVRKCEGVSPHTPKATPTWGDGVPVDSRNFREQLQGSNLNGLWRSLYHRKAFEA